MKKLTLSMLAVVLSSISLAHAADLSLKSLQAEIQKQDAHWIASDKWTSQHSKSEMKRMLGAKVEPHPYELDMRATKSSFPPSLDWRSKDGMDWVGAAKNQGNCGSCVAFASVETMESQLAIDSGLPWLKPKLSEQAAFNCYTGSCSFGQDPGFESKYLKNRGTPDDACMPYTSGSTGEDVDCDKNICADASSRTVRIADYKDHGYFKTVDEVKEALQHGPMMITMIVWEDFYSYTGGIYKHVKGAAQGGHAVSMIGYDDAKHALLIRNSWGPEWGENGFGWIDWNDDDTFMGFQGWSYTSNPAAPISVTVPTDRQYVSGTLAMTAKAASGVTEKAPVSFRVLDDKGASTLTMAATNTRGDEFSANLDTTTLKDGRYQILVEGADGKKSQVREFFVINHEPTLAVSFVPAHGVNVKKPLNGRPEFVITVNSTPVPMQRIRFSVYDLSGKLMHYKTNDMVIDQMTQGWRTSTVPNGQYNLQVHGEVDYLGKTYSADSAMLLVTVKNKG